jgi:hypothetical protein
MVMATNLGRKTKITSDVLAKLEEAFLMGCNDEEACLLAEIDPATLYRYCQKNPSFASKKEILKRRPSLIAKKNVIKALENGDVDLSRWYLERRSKEEFNPKYSMDIKDDRSIITGFTVVLANEAIQTIGKHSEAKLVE